MVPQRLLIRNFLCYADNCPEVDFSDIGVACLCGDNGHGKSALLDAITWAVWGAARARTDDELIHAGRVDMQIQFDFRVGHVRYRVLRKRRRGTAASPGRVMLEFHVLSDGIWKPLTGATSRETQQRIVDAVRLDYETFRNSAFLMQGRADEFTLKAPGERKKVLAEILGLGAYDSYEAKAREDRRAWEAETRRLDAQIAQFAAELAREPAYVRERDETQQELAEVEVALKERRGLVEGLRTMEASMNLLRAQAETAARDRVQAQERADRAGEELARQRTIITTRGALLARREAIRDAAEALRRARAVETDQTERLSRVSALQREQTAAQKEIDLEQSRLESAAERLRAELARQQGTAARLDHARALQLEAETERTALDQQEKHLASQRQELQEQNNTVGQFQAANKRLREDMNELARKRDELDRSTGSLCPICRTELGPAGKQRARDTYEAEGKALAAQFKENRSRREAAEARCSALQVEIRRLEAELATRLAALQRRLSQIERDEREATEAASRLPELERDLEDVSTRLKSESFAIEARGRLAAAKQAIAGAAYDEEALGRARAQVRALAAAESELRELELAEQAVEAARQAAHRAEQELQEWQKALAAARERERAFKAQLAEQRDPTEPLQRALEAIVSLDERDRGLRLALGAAEQKLDDCRRYRRLHDAMQQQNVAARLKQQIYDDLAVAFGRKGVQALIIDSVIPEIEEEANRLLARMSNGRMSVALTTQRQSQKGQAIETLDISISDELGTRSYELFSGGEAFRINLALRIGLSKLLARRAGAPLPTLIIDEGFGTQDAAGRERLLEAMNAVSRDFECLIIITHLDELKDQFERQIRVEKTPTGSVARVV